MHEIFSAFADGRIKPWAQSYNQNTQTNYLISVQILRFLKSVLIFRPKVIKSNSEELFKNYNLLVKPKHLEDIFSDIYEEM